MDKEKLLIRPYGDRKEDGVVQVSFVLPVPASDKAKEAAAQVAKKLGLSNVLVAAMEKAGEDYSWASHMKTTGEDNVLRLTVTVR